MNACHACHVLALGRSCQNDRLLTHFIEYAALIHSRTLTNILYLVKDDSVTQQSDVHSVLQGVPLSLHLSLSLSLSLAVLLNI